ncbi:hypothetical protein JCM3775_001874 [Rhodotorula graminis]
MAALQTAVSDLVSPVVVATFLACVLYGVLLYMSATYFLRFGSTDRLAFKLLVGFLTLSALGDTMNDCAWAWRSTVTALLDPSVLALVPAEFVAYACFTGPNVLICQAFFTWRVWVVSEMNGRRNWWLPLFLLQLELAAAGLACFLAYWGSQATSMVEFSEITTVMYTWLGASLLCDLLITVAITYYLLIRPTRIVGDSVASKLSSPVGRIVLKTFQTNAASLAIQLLVLVVIVTKGSTLWYAVPGYLESKIYVISVLATLNARKSTLSSDAIPPVDTSYRLKTTQPGSTTALARRARQTGSMPVHVLKEVHCVDEAESDFHGSKDLEFESAPPFAVRFEGAQASVEGDIELGKRG